MKQAILTFEGKNYELPVYTSSFNEDVIDISPLAKDQVYTFDPGYTATASTQSTITYIDGQNGILLHRGYPIESLAEQATFTDLTYLLLNGKLANAAQLETFNQSLVSQMTVDPRIQRFIRNFPSDAHPMAMMLSVVGSLPAFYNTPTDYTNSENRLAAATQLIGHIATIAAMCYRHALGQDIVPPSADLSYAENFLRMLFGTQEDTRKPNSVLTQAIDRIFILHADHEQNASTSTVRLAGSTGANPAACIAAGIAALWGPAHGGANEACLTMLQDIGNVRNIPTYIRRAKDKQDPFRLMGFGHRVYKNYDPRATVMREACHEVLQVTGQENNALFQVAMELERIAREDDYFIARKLYPNVDFYSGITLNALGIPTQMFTAIFALARTAGWVSQWHEMLSSNYRIGRPRQLYLGEKQQKFIEIADRK